MERVYLVGFMGSGKSTVGALLAARLGLDFVDLDEAIEQADGRSVAEIFKESGEVRFREIESSILRRVSGRVPKVVALGGGAYADPQNREFISRRGIAVYLETDLSTILERIEIDASRPLFGSPNQVRALYDERLPSYRMAPVRVRTDGLDPDGVVERVVGALQSS